MYKTLIQRKLLQIFLLLYVLAFNFKSSSNITFPRYSFMFKTGGQTSKWGIFKPHAVHCDKVKHQAYHRIVVRVHNLSAEFWRERSIMYIYRHDQDYFSFRIHIEGTLKQAECCSNSGDSLKKCCYATAKAQRY